MSNLRQDATEKSILRYHRQILGLLQGSKLLNTDINLKVMKFLPMNNRFVFRARFWKEIKYLLAIYFRCRRETIIHLSKQIWSKRAQRIISFFVENRQVLILAPIHFILSFTLVKSLSKSMHPAKKPFQYLGTCAFLGLVIAHMELGLIQHSDILGAQLLVFWHQDALM